jgi:putative autotransporter adhesin-like protein
MKRNIQILIFGVLSAFLLLISCNKEGAGCFDKAGNTKTIVRDIGEFTTIDVTSNVDVQLLTEGNDKVEVTAGENLISGISLEVKDGVLKIENRNSCFWSRGYVKPLVSIRNSALEQVFQHGYGRIYCTDTLTISTIKLIVEDASGAIDLILDANSINVVSNNIGPITLTGITNSLSVGHYWSDGILDARNLKTQDCNVNHNGSNRMDVNVTNKLGGSINSIGNVYLYGQSPSIREVILTDEGEIIEKY